MATKRTRVLTFLLTVFSHSACSGERLPSYKQLAEAIDLGQYRARFANTYDKNGDGVFSVEEARKTFEYATEKQIDSYWRECDTDANARLTFEEWLPCAGVYSDNGERFLNTEWDDLVQEGVLNLDFSEREDI